MLDNVLYPWRARLGGLCVLLALMGAGPSLASAQNTLWSADRAATVSPGRVEVGLTSPTRFALSEELELSSTLLLNLAVPNLELKAVWSHEGRWRMASRHRLTYPTLFFNLVSREGTGGLLPPTTEVPQIVGFENEVILERVITPKHSVMLSAGVAVAPRLTDGELPLLDFPFLYPRLAATKTWATFRSGAKLRGQLGHHWGYLIGAEAFLLPAVDGGVALEQELSLAWRISRTWSASVGYLMSFAHYPYGDRFHVTPLFDVIWAVE